MLSDCRCRPSRPEYSMLRPEQQTSATCFRPALFPKRQLWLHCQPALPLTRPRARPPAGRHSSRASLRRGRQSWTRHHTSWRRCGLVKWSCRQVGQGSEVHVRAACLLQSTAAKGWRPAGSWGSGPPANVMGPKLPHTLDGQNGPGRSGLRVHGPFFPLDSSMRLPICAPNTGPNPINAKDQSWAQPAVGLLAPKPRIKLEKRARAGRRRARTCWEWSASSCSGRCTRWRRSAPRCRQVARRSAPASQHVPSLNLAVWALQSGPCSKQAGEPLAPPSSCRPT